MSQQQAMSHTGGGRLEADVIRESGLEDVGGCNKGVHALRRETVMVSVGGVAAGEWCWRRMTTLGHVEWHMKRKHFLEALDLLCPS